MSTRYLRNDRVLWRRSQSAVLLMFPGQHEVVSLNGPGTALWELLGRPRTISEVINSLASVYGVAVDTVAADIAPVLEDLIARRLVRLQEAT